MRLGRYFARNAFVRTDDQEALTNAPRPGTGVGLHPTSRIGSLTACPGIRPSAPPAAVVGTADHRRMHLVAYVFREVRVCCLADDFFS